SRVDMSLLDQTAGRHERMEAEESLADLPGREVGYLPPQFVGWDSRAANFEQTGVFDIAARDQLFATEAHKAEVEAAQAKTDDDFAKTGQEIGGDFIEDLARSLAEEHSHGSLAPETAAIGSGGGSGGGGGESSGGGAGAGSLTASSGQSS